MTIVSERLAKLDKIRAMGLDPYGHSGLVNFNCILDIRADHSIGKFLGIEKDKAPIRTVSGRVMLRRGHGKLSFLTIQSDGNQIQIALDHSRLTPQRQELTKLIDLGDIIAVEGIVFPTKTNECTIWANTFFITAKSLVPPPDKVHGLEDPDLRFRNRHIDLLNLDVYQVMIARSRMIAEIRKQMALSNYIEVETPILQSTAGGAAAKPFSTHHNTLDMDMFLRIAPELYLKRLLVGGMEKVYEIGKNFRNEGISTKHNPEFTVIEAYEANGDYKSMMHAIGKVPRIPNCR